MAPEERKPKGLPKLHQHTPRWYPANPAKKEKIPLKAHKQHSPKGRESHQPPSKNLPWRVVVSIQDTRKSTVGKNPRRTEHRIPHKTHSSTHSQVHFHFPATTQQRPKKSVKETYTQFTWNHHPFRKRRGSKRHITGNESTLKNGDVN